MAKRSPMANKVLALARRAGVLRIKDLKANGIHPEYARRLLAQGLLVKSGRGLYVPADADFTERHSLAEACKRTPRAVVCLMSALRFHDLTTQAPHEVWLAVDERAWSPKPEGLRLRIVRFSGQALTEGVETHKIEGVPVKVYNAAKTVADCFKYRNKIGADVALEALRDGWQKRKATMDDLWKYAKICRVAQVIKPYLESLT